MNEPTISVLSHYESILASAELIRKDAVAELEAAIADKQSEADALIAKLRSITGNPNSAKPTGQRGSRSYRTDEQFIAEYRAVLDGKPEGLSGHAIFIKTGGDIARMTRLLRGHPELFRKSGHHKPSSRWHLVESVK